MMAFRMKIASVVLLFSLNPNCDSFSMPLASAQSEILSRRIEDLSRDIKKSNTSIVRWVALLSPFLYIGLIEPRLQASGKDSLDKIELYSAVRCETRLLLKSFNTTGGRPSGPGALCRFNHLMAISTTSSVNGVSVKELVSFPGVALINLVGRGPSFRLLKCV